MFWLERIRRGFLWALKSSENLCAALGSILVFGITIWIMVDISSRTFLGRAVGGSFETGGLVMVSIIFLALAAVQAQGKHIEIPLLVDKLPHRIQKIISLVTLFTGLAFFSFIVKVTFPVTIQAYQQDWSVFGVALIPKWPAYASITLGSFLLCLRYVVQLVTKAIR